MARKTSYLKRNKMFYLQIPTPGASKRIPTLGGIVFQGLRGFLKRVTRGDSSPSTHRAPRSSMIVAP